VTHDWDDEAPPGARQFLEERLNDHHKVASWSKASPQIYVIERDGLSDVRVFVQHVYTLGISDYEAIRNAHPDVRAILSTQPVSQFGADAVAAAARDRVALFDFSGLLGALNKDGDALYRHRARD
jgi:hypothetical protein